MGGDDSWGSFAGGDGPRNRGYTHLMVVESATSLWVLLCYRLPREPSTPRITVWRKLKRLGVSQLTDGLVTLPADARTREQLEWIAQEVIQAGGQASIWLAHPATAAQERQVAAAMAAARADEYDTVVREASAGLRQDARTRQRLGERLRAELHRIERRDFFPPPQRKVAQAAVRALLSGQGTQSAAPAGARP